MAGKEKAQARDNSGPKELVHVLQVAFENNWPGAVNTGPSGKKTKKAERETVVVVDDKDDEEDEKDKSKYQALATAFTHSSMSPNVASTPTAINDIASMEVVVPLPTKRARTHARAKGRRHPHTPTSPRRKRQRMADVQEQDASDDSLLSMRRANYGAYTGSPSQGLNSGLAPLNRGGEGSINWRAGNVFGGGNNSPGKLVDEVSSPVRGFGGMLPPRATDEDYEEEEDIVGMPRAERSFWVVDGVVESSESVAAAAGSRVRTKSWRKALADEVEVGENNDTDDGPRAHAISAPVFTTARRKKRTPASSLSGKHDTPTQDTLYVDQGVDGQAMPQPILRSPHREMLTPDRIAEEFECPARCNYCNCSQKREETWLPSRLVQSRKEESRDSGTSQVPAAKQPATTTTTIDAQVFDAGWTHIMPVSLPTASPATATTTATAPAIITASPIPEPAQKQQQL
ncbi:hypothetical protein EDB86DRAFT_3085513 [Lactarius hatsudake]|nr:hypothetical protein EDB86DRAFT_3085513 [Lactarius hatsudake]